MTYDGAGRGLCTPAGREFRLCDVSALPPSPELLSLTMKGMKNAKSN